MLVAFSPLLLLVLQYHFLPLFYVYFIKSKIEHLTMALSKISSDLECLGVLVVMKANSDAFYHAFCP